MALLWSPSDDFIKQSNLYAFQQYVEKEYRLSFECYSQLQQWSIDHLEEFWQSMVCFSGINFGAEAPKVLTQNGDRMIDYRWFEGSTVSYAEHIFRNKTEEFPAIIFGNETGDRLAISWRELEDKVAAIQHYLLLNGISCGDRVAAFMPNIPEAVIAFLAVNSIGAIWSCCSPDFGVDSVVDRFQQIRPKAFFAAQTYCYNGKKYDKNRDISQIISSIPTIETTIIIDEKDSAQPISWYNIINKYSGQHIISFLQVPFSHPIWILYSSGTTGIPKAITHSTGGNLIEHYKALSLHQDLKRGDKFLWFSTTGWMMWNYALSSLLVGATLVVYDGSPAYPTLDALWNFVDRIGVTHFGVGAAYYLACMKQNLSLCSTYKFDKLKALGSTGSPLPNEGFSYIYQNIKDDVWLVSLSGGTDVCSAFVGGSPYLPVYEGEIQCRMLGAAIEAWSERNIPVIDEVGELMIVKPMPNMPVFFWQDNNDEKYLNAYFEENSKVWKHGDFIKITKNEGIIIYGRSDATLNRDGVRIGTAEIYSATEAIPEVKDSIIICIEKDDGTYYMPLFVVLNDDAKLDNACVQNIKNSLRTQYSPRHVPDAIIQVQDIPYTISGKKMETPLKKIFMGYPREKCYSSDAMRNPQCMEEYFSLSQNIKY